MAERASSTGPDNPSARETLAALDRQIQELRRDLAETLDLIERLRASCVALHGKIDAAEREHERLVSQF
jgi:predicted  nucleic acid-binding Zn-ribbon protein